MIDKEEHRLLYTKRALYAAFSSPALSISARIATALSCLHQVPKFRFYTTRII